MNADTKKFLFIFLFSSVIGISIAVLIATTPEKTRSTKNKTKTVVKIGTETIQYDSGELLTMEVIETLPAKAMSTPFPNDIVAIRYLNGGPADVGLASKGSDLKAGDMVIVSRFWTTTSSSTVGFNRTLVIHSKVDRASAK